MTHPAPAPDMADLARAVRALRAVVQHQPATVEVGRVCDIVTTATGSVGEALLDRIDTGPGGCGPVIAHDRYLCWLVPPGTAARGWSHPAARCTGEGQFTLPPTTHTAAPYPYWVRRDTGRRVDAGLLHAALDEADPAGTSRPAP
ncbi:hypothetical protein QNO07_18290 [Streptomyces sp. 549]|uniref:hypothetical protein n=1 Tax=Streptomyces sp. 549 TaxID=3049076 RepID=UPI0024C3012D|nr:hypothetical protein [Streptomyces sp. 549]MDK1475344.1 hypothetical protein [Streptomyces sp. 549]